MSLFGLKEKDDILALNAKITDLQAENAALQAKIPINQTELDKVSARLQEQQSALECVEHRLELVKRELAAAKGQVVETNEAVLLQSFGLYTPHYSFMTADEYKSRLLEIRAKQKDMIKSKSAVTGAQQWTVNGSTAQGKKMISDMQKLLLRAFNAECDDIIEHVRYNNIEQSEKRITASRDAISKLGDMMRISISPQYYRLKIDELHLAFEYQQKKQEEKDALKEARARMREEAKLEKELEAERAKLEKEQTHYENVLSKIIAQLDTAAEADKPALEEKIRQIETQLEKISEGFANVDYREANQRAGYVYVISNIGAFGENVYKIGMTRRLDPMERVNELGDASVPFDFDVHAMIFSDDAPKLEAALHAAFADKKLNFVNQRREFFNVTLDEIKNVVRDNFDKTVEFVELPPAEQYRKSILLRQVVSND
nr:MAG TPA: helicase [Caudoviricetes sp.]